MDECWPTVASPASVRLNDDPVIDIQGVQKCILVSTIS